VEDESHLDSTASDAGRDHEADDGVFFTEKSRQIDVHGHFFGAKIDPLHHFQRLSTPAPHTLEQLGNSRLMDLGFSGQASEFRSIREERHNRLSNEALDLARRQSPTSAPIGRGVCSGARSWISRDVVAIASAGLDRVARRQQRARFIEEFSAQRAAAYRTGLRGSSRRLVREPFLDRVPSIWIDDRWVLPLVAFSTVCDASNIERVAE